MTGVHFGRIHRSTGATPGVKAVALALAGLLLVAAVPAAQTSGEPEEFTAFAVNMGTYTIGSTASLIMTVNRWTPQAERDELFTVLREKGQRAFLDALQDTKRVGYLRTPQSVGYELRLALDEQGKDGGRRVILATDRQISFAEARNRPPTIDYPFTVIDMTLGPDGTGEGTMSVAARIVPAGRTVVVENFDTQPVRLTRVESRKLTKR